MDFRLLESWEGTGCELLLAGGVRQLGRVEGAPFELLGPHNVHPVGLTNELGRLNLLCELGAAVCVRAEGACQSLDYDSRELGLGTVALPEL